MNRVKSILGKRSDEPRINEIYDIQEAIGEGAFGVVRRVINKATKEEAACKIISKSKLENDEDIEDIKNEIAILNHVGGHSNIVSFKVLSF